MPKSPLNDAGPRGTKRTRREEEYTVADCDVPFEEEDSGSQKRNCKRGEEEEDRDGPATPALPPKTRQTTIKTCLNKPSTLPSGGGSKNEAGNQTDDLGGLSAGYIIKASSLKEGGDRNKAGRKMKKKKNAPGPSIRQFLIAKPREESQKVPRENTKEGHSILNIEEEE